MKLTIREAAKLMREMRERENSARQDINREISSAYREAADAYLQMPAFTKRK